MNITVTAIIIINIIFSIMINTTTTTTITPTPHLQLREHLQIRGLRQTRRQLQLIKIITAHQLYDLLIALRSHCFHHDSEGDWVVEAVVIDVKATVFHDNGGAAFVLVGMAGDSGFDEAWGAWVMGDG